MNKIYRSGDQDCSSSLIPVGCRPKIRNTFTSLYPTHICMNSWKTKLCPRSGPEKGFFAILFAIIADAS